MESRRLSTSQATQDLQVEAVQRTDWAAHDTPEVSFSKESLSNAIIHSEYFQMPYIYRISHVMLIQVALYTPARASSGTIWLLTVLTHGKYAPTSERDSDSMCVCVRVWLVRCAWDVFVMPIDEELAQASNARKPKNMVASPQYQHISTHINTMQLLTLLEQFNKGDRLEDQTMRKSDSSAFWAFPQVKGFF